MFDFYKKNIILAPVNGQIVEIESVDDFMFSQKIIGDGLAIKPLDGQILAPCKGTVECILIEKHALFISCEDKTQILIHFGLDTVEMKGEGFECHVCVKQNIKIGDLLMSVDLEKIKKNKKDDTVIVVIPQNKNIDIIHKNTGQCLAAKTPLFKYKKFCI